MLGETRLPSDLTLCHSGLDVLATLALLFELILLFWTRSLDCGALVLQVAAREPTSVFSVLTVVDGERIALILIEFLKGTALVVGKSGAALVLTGTVGARRLDIVQELDLL